MNPQSQSFKRILLTFTAILMLAGACTKRPDDIAFIREMYEQTLYEDYAFLETHCSDSLLSLLASEYEYDGGGYAVWKFRSGMQDGPTNEHAVVSIEETGDGWYTYKAIDMGIPFTKRIKLSHKGGKTVIEALAEGFRRIAPLPSGLDLENLQDCTVPAKFTVDDFRWMGGNLTMTVYSQNLYDAVEISLMQVGDTLVYRSEPGVVERISESGGCLDINGGLDEGGCCLAGYEGGTYIARDWDDHATYTSLGSVQLPLSEDFVIIDCGLDPQDPVDTIRTGQKLYLENLKDSRREFFSLNTRVTVENGLITEINRRWIP